MPRAAPGIECSHPDADSAGGGNGPGRRDEDGDRIQMDVGMGDKVLYAKYAGTEIKITWSISRMMVKRFGHFTRS